MFNCPNCNELITDLLNNDSHLNLEVVLEEIIWTYRFYGLEKDENLTLDAIKLKKEILYFVNAIKGL